jgi:hypothetical protein
VVDGVEAGAAAAPEPAPELPLEADAFAPPPPPKRFADELRGPDEDETVFAVFEDVIVTEEPVEAVVELAAAELAFAPREDIRFPCMLPRLPMSRGAVMAAKRSAPIEPLTRSVRCTSPTATTAVRIAVEAGPPPPSLGDRRSRLR